MILDESTVWVPQTEQDKELVRQQMHRLLETHHFRNSRRYPALFRFIVEETLEGRGEYLKERLIGVQVFGKAADYDTAADPVVRITIAEIRKRIAQYYHDEAHDGEMRIELLPGSYAAEFRPGREGRLEHLPDKAESSAPTANETIHTTAGEHFAAVTAQEKPRRSLLARFWIPAVAVAACVLTGVFYASWEMSRPTATEELWAPLISAHRPIMLVLPAAGGKFGDNMQPQPTETNIEPQLSSKNPWVSFLQLETGGENVVFADTTALMKISNLLATKHAETYLRLNNATSLDDLRQGPAVLIGGMDNQWTLRALSRLRYHFAGSDEDAYWIQDRQDPGNRRWALDLKTRIQNVTKDYALIARVHDEATGQPAMLVAGIGMSGTAAAGEFLVTPSAIEELRRQLGEAAFRDKDFEAVLSTHVVNGIAGSAKILTVQVE